MNSARNFNQAPGAANVTREMPRNLDAEAAVLGSILVDPVFALKFVQDRLRDPDCFYSTQHQEVFRALCTISTDKRPENIDLVTVVHELETSGRLGTVGGPSFLTQLMTMVPSAANVEQYVEIVHQNFVLRQLIHTTSGIMDRCYQPQNDIREFLGSIEKDIFSISQQQGAKKACPIGDMMIEAINHLDGLRMNRSDALGIPTGYNDLDRKITGLQPGEMFVLAARPSIGKTALALNIATNIAMGSEPRSVGFFSLEMSTKMLVLRMLCSRARVSLGDIREGAISNARWQEIMQAGQELRQAPIYIDDTGSIDIIELRARARRMKMEQNIQVLFVDYLQMLNAGPGNKNTTRENAVSMMSGGLKSLAKELAIPVVVLAQLNRQSEQGGQKQKPKLAQLRESGAIEQDADVVALLHREREVESADPNASMGEGLESELIIAKHRNGPTGIVKLTFIPKFARFENSLFIRDDEVPE